MSRAATTDPFVVRDQAVTPRGRGDWSAMRRPDQVTPEPRLPLPSGKRKAQAISSGRSDLFSVLKDQS
jgi:hypothetical protein